MSSPALDRLAALSIDDFAPHVGEAFRVEEPAVELTLEQVEAAGAAAGSGQRAFSLVLRGPAEPLLEQATYALEGPGLGRLVLFLVPVGADGESIQYEVIFN